MPFSEAIKLSVKERAHFCCCICLESNFLDVHHIIPEAEGGPDNEDNAAPLCVDCHDKYGDNPKKRKFIKQKRNWWYKRCDQQTLAGSNSVGVAIRDDLAGIARIVRSSMHLIQLKNELNTGSKSRRADADVVAMLEQIQDEMLFDNELTAQLLERSNENEPKTAFEWGALCGMTYVLEWVLGKELEDEKEAL